jgi:DNA-binding MarR family transcriptional regulator
MKKMNIDNLFKFRDYAKIVKTLERKDKHQSLIAKDVDVTYSHVVIVANELAKKNIVTRTKDNRKVVISLTEKGKRLAKAIREVETELK